MKTFKLELNPAQSHLYQIVMRYTNSKQPEQSLVVPIAHFMLLPTSQEKQFRVKPIYTSHTQLQNLHAAKLSWWAFNWTYLLECNLKRDDYSYAEIKNYIENEMFAKILTKTDYFLLPLHDVIGDFEDEITTIGVKSFQDLPQMLSMIDTCNVTSEAYDRKLADSFDENTKWIMCMNYFDKLKGNL